MKNSGVKFLGFIGIMIIAVICGYLTARYIAAPLLGYDTEVLKIDFPSKMAASTTEKEEDKGYVLQFGVFSSPEGAEQLQQSLQKDGIETEVHEAEGKYKVQGRVYDTKEEALEQLENMKESKNVDVFVTAVS